MTRKQRLQPMLASATLVAILLAAVHAFGASAETAADAHSSVGIPAADASMPANPDGVSNRSPRRLTSHHLRHSLRMPFFSFQPLG